MLDSANIFGRLYDVPSFSGDNPAGAVRPSVVPAGPEEPDESAAGGEREGAASAAAAAQGGLPPQLQELVSLLNKVPVSGVRISVSKMMLKDFKTNIL